MVSELYVKIAYGSGFAAVILSSAVLFVVYGSRGIHLVRAMLTYVVVGIPVGGLWQIAVMGPIHMTLFELLVVMIFLLVVGFGLVWYYAFSCGLVMILLHLWRGETSWRVAGLVGALSGGAQIAVYRLQHPIGLFAFQLALAHVFACLASWCMARGALRRFDTGADSVR